MEIKEFLNEICAFSKETTILLPVATESMEPEIRRGEMVKIIPIGRAGSLKINDIIAYRVFDDHITMHRIVNIAESRGRKMYLTKGDNNKDRDPYLVSENRVVGLVVKVGKDE